MRTDKKLITVYHFVVNKIVLGQLQSSVLSTKLYELVLMCFSIIHEIIAERRKRTYIRSIIVLTSYKKIHGKYFFKNRNNFSFQFLIANNYSITNAIIPHSIFTSLSHWFKTGATVISLQSCKSVHIK